MVQLMASLHSGKIEDFAEEEYGSLEKRARLEAAPHDQVILKIRRVLGVILRAF